MQWITGRIIFAGDAVIVLLYLGAFLLSLAVGSGLNTQRKEISTLVLNAAMLALVVSAMASVGIALLQWTGNAVLGLWSADLPPGARPFANVGQPNHLCTLAFLGLCGLLLLRETACIGVVGFWVGATYILAGMVLSGSRTGWVQVTVLVLLALTFLGKTSSRLRGWHLIALSLIYVAATLAWPLINEALLLSGGRGVMKQIEGGARLPLWIALLDAVGREPWSGYGWQQVAVAQQAVSLDYPPIQRHFEHSHNIALDLLLWAGIPMGGAIIVFGALALWLQVRAIRDPRALWLVAAVLGVISHGFLEFPIEYAYFLIPAGLALGAANALGNAGPQVNLGVWMHRVAAVAGLVVLAVVGLEYLQAEQSHRLLRLESARVGTTGIESKAPDLLVLTQLGAILEFARTEAHTAMSPAELERMRAVAQRYPFPPIMLRYALAVGLNGNPAEARLTLARLCSVHPPDRCDEARESWTQLRDRFPTLTSAPLP